MQRRLIAVNIHEDAILCFYTHIILPYVFEMSVFVTYLCFEWCTPLINGCVHCAFFNAVLNVYLHN